MNLNKSIDWLVDARVKAAVTIGVLLIPVLSVIIWCAPPLPRKTVTTPTQDIAMLKQKAMLIEQRQKCVAALWPVVFAQPKPDPGFFATTSQNNLMAFVERACKI